MELMVVSWYQGRWVDGLLNRVEWVAYVWFC